jgi:antitoxin (DNA-binding transcriptional repressor) of toxin-antitoxin stability system
VQIGITLAKKRLHELSRRCAVEPVILTRNGKAVARLIPLRLAQQKMDARILRRLIAGAPFDLNDLFGKEE